MNKVNRIYLLTFFLCLGVLFSLQLNNSQQYNKINSNESSETTDLPIESRSYSNVNESFSKVYKVSNISGSGLSSDARIATDSSKNIHIVWADDTRGDYDIYYRNFTYSTQTWSKILNISTSALDSRFPDIEIDDSGNIHITWVEDRSGSADIYYRYIESPNFQRSSIIPIANHGSDDYDSPCIATNGTDVITISWFRMSFGNVYVAYYDFNTETLLNTEQIIPAGSGNSPQITYSDNGVLHLIFRYDTGTIGYVNRSGGWSALYNMSQGLAKTTVVENPDIEYDKLNDKIYVCWSNRFTPNAYNEIVTKSKDIGGSFRGVADDVISYLSDDHEKPRLEMNDNSGLIYVVYRRGTNYIYAFRLNDDTIYKVSDSDTLQSFYPDLAVDVNGSIHYTYEDRVGGSDSSIKYRLYDTFLPQLNVTYPLNDTYLGGIETITATVEPDTVRIEYYYNDTGSWIYIGETNQSASWEFDWKTNKTGSELNLRNILLNATAYDKNGVDEAWLIGGLVVDNIAPQQCEIVEITDNSMAYDRNSTKGNRYFNGTVTIRYRAIDNNSLVDRVELYNGTTYLMENTSRNAFTFDSTAWDGNYTDLKIYAYDRSGNLNISAAFPSADDFIVIDNVAPVVSFTDLTNGTEVTTNITLKISTDLDVVNTTYWNFTGAMSTKEQIINTITKSPGEREIVFPSGNFNGSMKILAVVTDRNNHTSSRVLKLRIDNITPGINVTNLNDTDQLGLAEKLIYIEVEIDSLMVNMSYKYGIRPYEQIGSNSTFNPVTGKPLRKKTTLLFDKAPEIDVDIEEGFYIKFWSIDDVGLEHEVELHLFLNFERPPAIGEDNVTIDIDKYDITIEWVNQKNTSRVLIYRSITPFDEDELNDLIKDDPNKFYDEVGKVVGSKYCVGNVSVLDDTHEFTDEVDGPNVYYYFLIGTNQFDSPSDVTLIEVEVDHEDFDREFLESPTNNLVNYFLGYLAFMGLLNIYGLKRVKKKFFKRRVKLTKREIEEEQAATFDKEGLDLDARVEKEESVIISKPRATLYEPIQETPVSFEKEETTTTIDKCPTCGWILSSTATKCPRCGWQRL